MGEAIVANLFSLPAGRLAEEGSPTRSLAKGTLSLKGQSNLTKPGGRRRMKRALIPTLLMIAGSLPDGLAAQDWEVRTTEPDVMGDVTVSADVEAVWTSGDVPWATLRIACRRAERLEVMVFNLAHGGSLEAEVDVDIRFGASPVVVADSLAAGPLAVEQMRFRGLIADVVQLDGYSVDGQRFLDEVGAGRHGHVAIRTTGHVGAIFLITGDAPEAVQEVRAACPD